MVSSVAAWLESGENAAASARLRVVTRMVRMDLDISISTAGQRPRRPVVCKMECTAGKEIDGMHETVRAGCRNPATLPLVDVRGRSPGSEDLIRRLPGKSDFPVAFRRIRASLPLRGQHRDCIHAGMRTCFPFHPSAEKSFGNQGTADKFVTEKNLDDEGGIVSETPLPCPPMSTSEAASNPQKRLNNIKIPGLLLDHNHFLKQTSPYE